MELLVSLGIGLMTAVGVYLMLRRRTFPVVDGVRYSVPGDRAIAEADGRLRLLGRDSATINSGGNCPKFTSDIYLQGSKALLKIRAHGGDFMVTSKDWDKPILGVPKGWALPTVTPARNFADVILGRDEPRCDGEMGVRLADLMDCLYHSAGTGLPARPEDLPGARKARKKSRKTRKAAT